MYLENLVVLKEPQEDTPGEFQLIVKPAVGMGTTGCQVALKLSFVSTYSEEMLYEVLQDTAVGLTAEQLQELTDQIEQLVDEEGEELMYQTVIQAVEDYLSQANSSTKTLI